MIYRKERQLAWIALLTLSVRSVLSREEQVNLCPEVTGCECSKTWSSGIQGKNISRMTAACKYTTDPALHLLLKYDLEKFLFLGNTFTNISTLKVLQNTTATSFVFIKNKFPNENRTMFDWDWLPNTAASLSLTQNGFYGFQVGNPNNTCNMTKFRDHFKLMVEGEKVSVMLSCLPNRIDKISLFNLPETRSTEKMSWPENLVHLKVSGGGAKGLLNSNPAPSLATLWISAIQLENDSWPVGLPIAPLKRLILTQCGLKEVPEEEMARLGRTNTLKLMWLNYNKLTDVPKNLPESLEDLSLRHNEIRHITSEHWSTLKNLTFLDLTYNHLLTVPLKLPSAMRRIFLSHNSIYISLAEAFQHLKQLESLDLSNNKLRMLPKGIQPGLKSYSVHKNLISLVNDPSEYDFCIKCNSVRLYGNPWHCDIEMLKMLNWFVFHGVDVEDLGQDKSDVEYLTFCNKIGIHGVDKPWLDIVIEFMNYFNAPPNDICTYEIEVLSCIDVNLTTIPERIPPGLKYISITDNPSLSSVPDFKFVNQTQLLQLKLTNSSLIHVPIGLPSSLLTLNLNHNKLGNWSQEDLHAFKNLTALRYLHLSDNYIKVLYSWQFDGLKDLRWIGLSGNPLHCDCSMQSFSYYFESIVPRTGFLRIRAYPMCKTPVEQENVDIRQLVGYYSYGINCIPMKCSMDKDSFLTVRGVLNCSKAQQNDERNTYSYGFVPGEEIHVPTSSFWIEMDLSGLELETNQINYQNLSRLEMVDLSSNKLDKIPLYGLPASIKDMNLSHNEITVLPSHDILQNYFPKIHTIDLSFNQIRIVTSELSNFEVIPSLFLSGNPLICNCTTQPLIAWVHINVKNVLMARRHQLQKLTCQLQGKSGIVQKISQVKDTEYCPTQQVAAILGMITAAVVISLLTLVLANVFYQRKRSEKVNAKILLGFQGLLEKERNEGDRNRETGEFREYKFDAFISYDPNGLDAEFVISLLEELEDKRGYRLCLNERDFIPGTGITDNIVECIDVSKHVVLVLSHSFIASPWCQYEVQAALAELHQRRQSQLLISIFLEDISVDEDIARSVKTLLSLAPGLTVPQYMPDEGKEWQDFWKRLTELMPDPIAPVEV